MHALLLAVLMSAAGTSACTGGHHGSLSGDDPTKSQAPSTVDATVVLRLQQIGPEGSTPSDAARAAGATGCMSYELSPPNPGGPRWVIRLQLAAARKDAAIVALRHVSGAYEIDAPPPNAANGATPIPSAGETASVATPC